MADFTSGVTPTAGNGVGRITNPVDTATSNGIQSAGNILSTVGSTLVQGYTQASALAQQNQNASFLDNYAQDLLKISDMQQQGALKSDQALRQFRLKTSQVLADHPLLRDDIFKTYGNIVEKAGLGQNVVKDYQQQQDNANQLQQQALTDAQKAGWGSPNDPPEVQQQMAEKHQQFLFAQSQLEAANDILDHKIKENNVTSSGLAITREGLGIQSERLGIANQSVALQRNNIGLAQDQAKKKFLDGAQTISDTYFSKFNQDMTKVLSGVQDGSIKREDAIASIQQQLASIHQQTGSLATAYDAGGSLEALVKPIDMLAQATIDTVSGKNQNQVTENTVANIIGTKNIQLLTSDPNFLTLTATSKMIPAGAGALQNAIGDAAINLLKRNKAIGLDPSNNPDNSSVGSPKPGDPTHNDDVDHNAGVDQYFSVVKGAISNVRSGNNDPALKSEISGNLTNILRGVGTYGPTVASPTELNSVVKFLADPQVGSYMREHPEVIKGDAARQAVAVKDQEYDRVVLPLIQEEFVNNKVHIDQGGVSVNPFGGDTGVVAAGSANNVSSPSVINITFNGTGAQFISNNSGVSSEVKRLNREVAPVINNIIRANAHLAGSSDYKASYEDFLQRLTPAKEDQSSE